METAITGVKMSLIIGLPCGIGLFMLAEPIIALHPSVGCKACKFSTLSTVNRSDF